MIRALVRLFGDAGLVVIFGGLVWLAFRWYRYSSIKAALPYIHKFVATYSSDDRVWPEMVSIPEEDIRALGTILANQGVKVEHGKLRAAVMEQLHKALDNTFAQSFFNLHPEVAGRSPALDLWTKAYVDTFENNLAFVPYFARLIQSKSVLPQGDVQKAVEAEVAARAHQRRVEAVSRAMQEGRARPRVTIEHVDTLPGLEFEELLGRLFQAMGYQSTVTQASGDQGADVVLEKFGERTVVQAKCYSEPVPNKAIQEVVASKRYYDSERAMVVTNSYFTDSARELAAANGVTLWDRDKLTEVLRMYL